MTAIRFENAPIPLYDKVTKTEGDQKGMMTDAWILWFDQTLKRLGGTPVSVATTGPLTVQEATIPATDVTGGLLPAGLYRVSYYTRITRAATVASSLDITITWTDGGVSPSFVGATVNGNTTTTYQEEELTIRIDAGAPITYTIVYASAGATSMQYSFDLLVEELGR